MSVLCNVSYLLYNARIRYNDAGRSFDPEQMIENFRSRVRGMSRLEGLIKLAITMIFMPFPILICGLGGFWLDYYKLHTLPLFSVLGALVGTALGFVGVVFIILFGRRRQA
jgi:hypothetical protein